MKYEVNMEIVKPCIEQPLVRTKFIVEFYHHGNDYGNGYGVSFDEYEDDKRLNQQCFDIRYDTDFDEDHPELWIADYIYHHWTGEKESYDVQKLTIERIEE